MAESWMPMTESQTPMAPSSESVAPEAVRFGVTRPTCLPSLPGGRPGTVAAAVRLWPVVVVMAWLPVCSVAQPVSEAGSDPNGHPYGTGFGGEVLLTNSGFGLGGYYHRAVTEGTSLLVEFSLGAGKDERELKFFRFGSSFIPNKAHYLLMMPVHAGVFRRLFRRAIEDNFRPYVQVTCGPVFGWEYPYFDDLNGNGRYDSDAERTYDSIGGIPRGHLRVAMGGTVALGAHFGLSRKTTQGVRIGYTFARFFQGIQLIEPRLQGAQRFFGSPTIALTFGKLL